MRLLHNTLALAAGAALVMAASACSEGSSRDASTGGSSNNGGASDGSGGSSDQGGSQSQGGAEDTGTGGSTSTELTEVMAFTFDADLEGFEVGWAESGGAQDTALQDATTITWDSANGYPDVGGMSSTCPFTGPENKAQLQVTLSPAADLTDGVVTAWIRLESGLTTDESIPGGAKLFIKDSAWVWASGPWRNLVEGEWVPLSLDAALPDYVDVGFDASQIMQVGVEYETGGGAGDNWTSATVTVDTIVLSVPSA